MKVVFHERFLESYTRDPASSPGRLDQAYHELNSRYSFVQARPCSENDILLVHNPRHFEHVKRDAEVFEAAMLAAGATIEAAFIAGKGEPAFALCRPPGHHASPDSCWGFCYFNNVAVAVKKYRKSYPDARVLIVDFDLHYGDGTANAFRGDSAVLFYELPDRNNRQSIAYLEDYLKNCRVDLLAVSAGFDRHVNDWGGMLTTDDYKQIGKILGEYTGQHCNYRLFAALEGGYNSRALAESIVSFLEGVQEGQGNL